MPWAFRVIYMSNLTCFRCYKKGHTSKFNSLVCQGFVSGLKEAVYLGVVHKATCKQAANLSVIETD